MEGEIWLGGKAIRRPKELYRDELESLVARRFRHARWYGQRPSFFSVIAPEPRAQAGHLAELPSDALQQVARHGWVLDDPCVSVVSGGRWNPTFVADIKGGV